MIAGYNPILQALLGTLFTWGLTAAGAALVFVFQSSQRKILDGSLGFAAGVMTAASYWSLLAPGIEMAEKSGLYGENGEFAFVPVSIGFVLGALFVYGADVLMPYISGGSSNILLQLDTETKFDKDGDIQINLVHQEEALGVTRPVSSNPTQRRKQNPQPIDLNNSIQKTTYSTIETQSNTAVSWKRILLLIIAITIHNIPEGLAVGVGFGAVGKSKTATFESARNLAIGIGIQNFPEGLSVSLPLRGSGMSVWKSFWYGQLSGMVEPIAGLFGAIAVVIAEPLLPYALAFAAGAMIYVVVDDIIPEAQQCGNGTLASWGAVVGFVVMMMLDVGLG